MKTAYEFRKKALEFARANGYDNIKALGLYNGYEVYEGFCDSWLIDKPKLGISQYILVNEKKCILERSVEALFWEISKLPKLIFIYEASWWNGSSYLVNLYSNGTLLCKKYPNPVQILPKDFNGKYGKEKSFENLDISEIEQIIKEKSSILKTLPKEMNNYGIFDGSFDKVKIGKYKFSGTNLFTAAANRFEHKDSRTYGFFPDEAENLYELQCIFKKIMAWIIKITDTDGMICEVFDELKI